MQEDKIKEFKQIRFTIVKPITVHITPEMVSDNTKIPLEDLIEENIVDFAREMVKENINLFNNIDAETDMMFNDIQTVWMDDIEIDGYHLY